MKYIFVLAIFSLSFNPAYALNCSNAMNQSDMNQCAGAEYKKADAQLNNVYKKVMARAEAAQKTQLKAAQNAWIKFRDTECAFQTSAAEGGSIHSMMVANCMQVKSQARTKELEALLHCKEGDMTCALPPN